jgi:pimeloyl-ACP methyl ester carboxylesterase
MPPSSPVPVGPSTNQRIVEILKRESFDSAMQQQSFVDLLIENSAEAVPLFPKETVNALVEARDLRRELWKQTQTGLLSNKNVVIVPGFMGSQLTDVGEANKGLIWIDPKLYFTSSEDDSEISALQLAKYDPNASETDLDPRVRVIQDGAVPILYAALRFYLETGRCECRTVGFDWRKDIDKTAEQLAEKIRGFAAESPGRPFFIIAHSQGSLVARRALKILGKDEARRIVNRLILIGPASFGTFSAAFALAGNHETIESLSHYGLTWPDDLKQVLQSFTGLYQLLPWKAGTTGMSDAELKRLRDPAFWADSGIDAERLKKFFAWGESLDTDFFNDRISIILGDRPTPSAVEFQDKKLVAREMDLGDGTVLDSCAKIPGVEDYGWVQDASHMTLPINPRVMQRIWRIISANRTMALARLQPDGRTPQDDEKPPKRLMLPETVPLSELLGIRKPPAPHPLPKPQGAAGKRPAKGTPKAAETPVQKVASDDFAAFAQSLSPPAPRCRRLRVFSYDPLLALDPEMLGMESIVLELPWNEESNDAVKLQPGPVGEYLEVVDYDPANGCFYPPVDLNHPNLLAQDGYPLSESDPRFHQQMVYAVGMATIHAFERALGRVIQWSPNLTRDRNGKVIPTDNQYVRRLRIYPHAMRQANAFYDSNRKALLFGYFPSRSISGSRVHPKGTVFTCLSHDVIAHEMTHAILDGIHRYFLEPSNPDVLAFHEAFADIVALFQHFSHPEVLRGQIAKVAGNLEGQSPLGQLAQQFGEANGLHGSLRSYLGKLNDNGVWTPITPDPGLIDQLVEAHDRGSILVAAMFTAFLTIYRRRTRDLVRIATQGTGVLPQGDLHPDLVGRLADEAAKGARHLLTIAIRALDYCPPVDLNYGNYLRALITADFDVVPNDGHLYRVAIVDAFRQWGIYPEHVKSLSVDSLLWNAPESSSLKLDFERFRDILCIGAGNLDLDRADMYDRQQKVQAELHEWMRDRFLENPKLAEEWGLAVSEDAPPTIHRETRRKDRKKSDGKTILPKFEIHSVRRTRRIGPDQQERVDILIEVCQKRDGYIDKERQARADSGELTEAEIERGCDFEFRGGATLIVDPRAGRIRYAITKKILSQSRLTKVREFVRSGGRQLGLRGNYFKSSASDNPLMHLHSHED